MFFGQGFRPGPRFARQQYYRPQEPQEVQLNWRVLIYAIPLLLFFLFSSHLSNSQNIDWSKVIKFDSDLDERQFQLLWTTVFKKQFGVQKSWLRDQSRMTHLSTSFYDNLKNAADELWAEKLRAACQARKNGAECQELKRHRYSV
jgi:hypothetical protein